MFYTTHYFQKLYQNVIFPEITRFEKNDVFK